MKHKLSVKEWEDSKGIPWNCPTIAHWKKESEKEDENISNINDYFSDFFIAKKIKFFYPTIRHHLFMEMVHNCDFDEGQKLEFLLYFLSCESRKLKNTSFDELKIDVIKHLEITKKFLIFSDDEKEIIFFNLTKDLSCFSDDDIQCGSNNHYWWSAIIDCLCSEYSWQEDYVLDGVPFKRLKEYIHDAGKRKGSDQRRMPKLNEKEKIFRGLMWQFTEYQREKNKN